VYQSRRRHIPAAWIAILAVLLAALAPTLSAAWRSQRSGGWVEICRALGSSWVYVGDDAAQAPDGPAPGVGLEHCPYCTLQAAGAVGMPPVPLVLGLLALRFAAPLPALWPPALQQAWYRALSRGPPAPR
jgi:hypothetical protein